jgi:hypothetical protein
LENINKIPNLIIPGFPKSGTSSFYDYLGQHPEIFASYRKESHIYSFNDRYKERFADKKHLHSFRKFYNEFHGEKYLMDASTTYLISSEALQRIRNDTENPKIIIVARDPIERIFSHFNWLRMLGYKQKKFKQEIYFENQKEFSAENNIKGNYKNYLEFSLYGNQLKRCFEVFDKEMIYILPLERLKNESENAFNEIFNFLEIDSISINKSLKNITPRKVKIKRNSIPTKIKIFEKKISSNIISESFLFQKTIEPISFSSKDEKFIFDLLKNDLEILKKMNLIFPEWKTVNKYL